MGAEGIRDQMEIIELEIIILPFPVSPRPRERAREWTLWHTENQYSS